MTPRFVTAIRVLVSPCLVFTFAAAMVSASRAAGRPPLADAATESVRQCQFVDSTLVPQMVMGVRRLTDEKLSSLPVRAEDSLDGPAVIQAKLFRPYFVVQRRLGSNNDERVLIQESYTAKKPIGWVDARQVEFLRSRYAYTYAATSADLHDTSKDSYERLLGQLQGGPTEAEDLVWIRQRAADAEWLPRRIDDIVPFIEIRLPTDTVEPDYPDTTPTHRFGIPLENRLVHMGAVCGGPIDLTLLDQLRQQNLRQAGLEMAFVVDETESMSPFFEGVADFVRTVTTTATGHGDGIRLAVSYYTDGPPGERVTASSLKAITTAEETVKLAESVRQHADKLPVDSFANAPERMLEGLRDSIIKAAFSPGANGFVAIVGDTGHEPADVAEKQRLIEEVAELTKKHDLHLFFAHVGRRKTPSEQLFREDFESIQQAASQLGIPPEQIVYQPADESTLPQELAKAQEGAVKARERRIEQINRMEARTPYTEPGPKLLKRFEALAISKKMFDELHLQFYIPSRGWLFHPLTQDETSPRPQFRQLFYLAPPERLALRDMLLSLQSQLEEKQTIDHDAAVRVFAESITKESKHPGMEQQVLTAWNRLPESHRSVGIFLEDILGIRLRATLPFPRGALAIQPENQEEAAAFSQRVTQLLTGLAGDTDLFWFDSSALIP